MSMDGVAVAIVLCCVVVVLMDCCCCCRDLCAEQKKRCRCQSAERVTCVGKVGSVVHYRKKEGVSFFDVFFLVCVVDWMYECMYFSITTQQSVDGRAESAWEKETARCFSCEISLQAECLFRGWCQDACR